MAAHESVTDSIDYALCAVRRLSAPFVCFTCRKSFKRPSGLLDAACPDCGEPTVELSRKFKAPPRSDEKAWDVVRFVVDHGFRYHSIDERVDGRWRWWRLHDPYPRSMAAAREFVRRHRAPFAARSVTGTAPPP